MGGRDDAGRIGRRRLIAGLGATAAAISVASPLRSAIGGLVQAVWDPLPLGDPDELGLRLPAGFRSSLVGVSGAPVGSTGYRWHDAPDGGACFAIPGSTDVHYVSNSEVPGGGGGVSAVRVSRSGEIVDARSILAGTSMNCAGGATPWGSWLSCEEVDPTGLVWECYPDGRSAVVRPALGAFRHEAVAVDAVRRHLYLTEDRPAGRLYRFVPDDWPHLGAGRLEAASVGVAGGVAWVEVAADRPERSSATTAFDGGEGIVLDDRELFFTTKGDERVWSLDLDLQRLEVFHDCRASPSAALSHVDNITMNPHSGHLFVAEDGGNMELCVVTRDPAGPRVVPVLRFTGHPGSEVAGPAFSPDGNTLFVSSQRGADGRGVTVRVTGPFRNLFGSIVGPAVVARHPERLSRP